MSDSLHAHYGVPDPEYAALFATLPEIDFPADPVAGRQVLNAILTTGRAASKEKLPDASKYTIVDHPNVPVAGGTAHILVRTITPTSTDGSTYPVFYWMHGGGFVMGTIEMSQDTLTRLGVELGFTVALVDYRLAPEHPHPIPVTDCFEGLKWVVSNASFFGGDISKGLIIGGDSAGGSLAAAVAHLARDDPFFFGKQVTGQVLHIPCVVDPRAHPEKYKAELRSLDIVEHANMAGLKRKFMFDIYEKHLKNPPEDPTASPLLFLSHANLPPAFIQISGLDLLRDEGLLYEKVLREAGVKTKLHVYQGVSHGFHMGFPQLAASKRFEEDYRNGLLWLLGGAKA
ncbi:Alpha/Beta hydrolase protein [Cristinia sonorae]|uniref:Alpha/Beta hydrolase protein n=1 Tax=Cristinia sonorae TaxID=1940300 RepID=A0A8K0UNM3_9AGAR|nr:Alpha/Beta hydrolase protein [Cristinia sonorae]